MLTTAEQGVTKIVRGASNTKAARIRRPDRGISPEFFRRKRIILADAAAEFLCFALVAFDFRVGRVIVNRLEIFGGDEIGENALVGV